MAAKQKLSRKQIRQELREPDVILETGSEIMEWARKNTGTVIAAGVALLAVLLGIGTYRAYYAAQQRDANTDLARSLALFDGPDPAAAAKDLETVAQHWKETSVGRLAATLAANAEIRSGEIEQAQKDVAALPVAQLPDYLRQQQELLTATLLEKQGENDKAAAAYAAAAQMSGPYTADALTAEVRLAELKGDSERATELKRQIYEQFPDRPDRDRYKVD